MATMNVSLPNQMRAWVDDSVSSGRYANASDYIRDLIRRDKDRDQIFDQMQKLISEGLESGESDTTVDDVWNRVKARKTGA